MKCYFFKALISPFCSNNNLFYVSIIFWVFSIYPKICAIQTHHSIVNYFLLMEIFSFFLVGVSQVIHSLQILICESSSYSSLFLILFSQPPHLNCQILWFPSRTFLSLSPIFPLPPIFWTSWTYIFSLLLTHLLAFSLWASSHLPPSCQYILFLTPLLRTL